MNSDASKERIVILFDIQEARLYTSGFMKKSDVIYCVTPEVRVYSENFGLAHIQRKDIVSSIDYDFAEKHQYAVINKIISDFNKFSKEISGSQALEIGTYFSFQLWAIIGQMLNSYLTIKSLVKKYPNKNYLIFTNGKKNKFFLKYRPDPTSTFNEILIKYLRKKNKNIEIIKCKKRRKFILNKASLIDKLPDIIIDWIRVLKNKRHFKNKSTIIKEKLLIVGGVFDWKEICKYQIFNSQFSIDILFPLRRSGSLIHKEKILEIFEKRFFENVEHIYDFNLLSEQISIDLSTYQKNYVKLVEVLSRYEACISAALTFPDDHFVAHIFEKLNKPVIIWQHGEKGQTNDPTAIYTELSYASDYMTYGPKVSELYSLMNGSTKLKNIITVGSLQKNITWNGPLAHKNSNLGKKYVLYATGKWQSHKSPIVSIDPDDRLINIQRKLFKYFENSNHDYEIIFKLNNTRQMNQNVLADKKVIIEETESFTKLLSNAACVILDTPATTLLESASTEIPIFVIGGRSKYRMDFLKKVKQRVIWEENIEDLLIKLDNFLTFGTYESDCLSIDFQNDYCSKIPKEQIIKNVTHAIKSAINKQKGVNDAFT